MTAVATRAAADSPRHGLAMRMHAPLPRWTRQVVHGTPITPTSILDRLEPTGFCLSYWNRRPIEPYLAKLHPESVLILDNGSYSLWMGNLRHAGRRPPQQADQAYWDGFYRWAMEIMRDVPQAILVVPDVIGGTVAQNVDLMLSIPPGVPRDRCMAVWHLDEPVQHLRHIASDFGMIGFGSAGRYRWPGSLAWRQRVEQAIDALEADCRDPGSGLCRPRLHALRGLAPMQLHEHPFVSGDSTNFARNHATRATGPGGIEAMQRRIEQGRYPPPAGPVWPDACGKDSAGAVSPRRPALQMDMLLEA